MKLIFLLLLMPLLVQAQDGEASWSPVVKGLRARLFVAPSHDPEYDKTYQVFVEFENVPIVGNLGPIEEARIFDYSEGEWKLDVIGPDHLPLPHVGPGVFDFMSVGWPLCLPPGGRLSFPFAAGGDTASSSLVVQPPGGQAPVGSPALVHGGYLHLSPALGWIIPPNGAYYLSGTFSGTLPKRGRGALHKNWNETLILPPILVPSH